MRYTHICMMCLFSFCAPAFGFPRDRNANATQSFTLGLLSGSAAGILQHMFLNKIDHSLPEQYQRKNIQAGIGAITGLCFEWSARSIGKNFWQEFDPELNIYRHHKGVDYGKLFTTLAIMGYAYWKDSPQTNPSHNLGAWPLPLMRVTLLDYDDGRISMFGIDCSRWMDPCTCHIPRGNKPQEPCAC